MRPFVSVIVPAFNEAHRIGALCDRLARQTWPADAFEVIVADNGSTDGTADAVHRASNGRVIVVTETRVKGPDAARNAALRVARGTVLAFTDADCAPANDWLERGCAALARGADLVAGRIRFTFGPRPNAAEIYDSVTFLQHDLSVACRGTAFTANLLARRAVFERLGPFDVGEGSTGDALFTYRATRSGFALVYDDRTIVHHPARDLRELLVKAHRIGFGQGHGIAAAARTQPLAGLASKPHLTHLLPWRLSRRLRTAEVHVSPLAALQVWLLAYAVVATAAAYALVGVLRGLNARALPGSPAPSPASRTPSSSDP